MERGKKRILTRELGRVDHSGQKGQGDRLIWETAFLMARLFDSGVHSNAADTNAITTLGALSQSGQWIEAVFADTTASASVAYVPLKSLPDPLLLALLNLIDMHRASRDISSFGTLVSPPIGQRGTPGSLVASKGAAAMSKRTILRVLLTRIVPMVVVMSATTAWAIIGEIIVTPPPAQITIGDSFNCKADETNNNDPIASYKWEVRRWYFNPLCAPPWQVVGTQNNLNIFNGFPVWIDVRLTVKYKQVGPMPPPPDSVRTTTIKIARADGVRHLEGANTPVSWMQAVALWHQVTSGGNDAGGYLAGTAQERLTNRTLLGQQQQDLDWGPAAPSSSFRLVQPARLFDEQSFSMSAITWNNIPVGQEQSVFGTATQELRILWSDPCDQTHYDQTLGSIDIVWRKVSADEWQVELSF